MKKSIKITIISAIIVIAVAAAAIIGTTVYHNSPDYQLSLAERYLSELNYEQAIIALEKYLEIVPTDVDAWLKLADAYYQLGYIDKAIETLERALTIVDDQRLRDRLEEYRRLKEPAVTETAVTTAAVTTTTTTTTTTAAPEPAPEENYIEYTIFEPSSENVISIGEGMFAAKKDDKYALSDMYGNLKTDYDYTKVFSAYGTEEQHYMLACENGNNYCLFDGNYNKIMDLGKPENTYYFNKEEPLIAVTYSGKSYWLQNNSTGEFKEYDDSSNAYLQIYRCRDGKLLYNWSNGDWIDGKGSKIDYSDPRISSCMREPFSINIQHQDDTPLFKYSHTDTRINQISSADDCINIAFYISPEYYVSDWTPQYEKAASQKYETILKIKKAFEAGRTEPYYGNSPSLNYSGAYNSFDFVGKAVYKNGEIKIEPGSGKCVCEKETYSIYDTNLMPTLSSDLMLVENGNKSYSYVRNDTDKSETRFGWTTACIYKDAVMCGRKNAAAPDNVDIAFFKPKWYSTRDTAYEKITSEWTQISDWTENVKYIGEYDDNIYYLTKFSPDDPEKTVTALFAADNTGKIVPITEWYDNLFWDDTDTYIAAKKGNKYCYIDRKGGKHGEYDDITSFCGGIAIVNKKGKSCFVNTDLDRISEIFECDSASAVQKNIFRIKNGEEEKFVMIGDVKENTTAADTTAAVVITTPAITTPAIITNVPGDFDEYYKSYSMSRDKAESRAPASSATKKENNTNDSKTKKSSDNSSDPVEIIVSDDDTTAPASAAEPAEIEQMLLNYIQGKGKLDKDMLANVTSLTIGGTSIVGVDVSGKRGTAFTLSNEMDSNYHFTGNFVAGIYNPSKENKVFSPGDLKDISFVKYMPKLTKLNIQYNKISDISELSELTELDTVMLSYNNISDISPLKKLDKISMLTLASNNISDISVLSGKKTIEHLYLSENKISNIEPLRDLDNLKYLVLSSNSISNVDPLKNKQNMKSVMLYDNSGLSQAVIEELKKTLPADCYVSYF